MFSILLALAGASVAEQMAPARQGMLQCQMPDLVFKTCLSLSKVSQAGPSAYRFETRMLIDPNGPVVATIYTMVAVRGPEVCDTVEPSDLDTATVTMAGKPLPPASAAQHLATFRRLFETLQGEICTQIVPGEQGMEKVLSQINGKRVPAVDYDMKWVDPEDGWIIAP